MDVFVTREGDHMNIFSNYSVNRSYTWGANFKRTGAGASGGLFQKDRAASGFALTGADRAGSGGTTSAGSVLCGFQGQASGETRRLRRKLQQTGADVDAVVTVVDKEAENAKTADAANDGPAQKTKRIINTQTLVARSQDKENGFIDLTGMQETEEDPLEEKFEYNFQEISAQIQRAKTSGGAGQAAIKATRKVLELKRRLAAGGEDLKEVQLALTHAKRIERAAKKKKRHLELEELITATQKRDDRLEKEKETQTSVSPWDARDISEERVTDELAEIDRQQSEQFAEIAKTRRGELAEIAGTGQGEWTEIAGTSQSVLTENTEESTDEMIASIDALLDEISGKDKQVLEETLEQLGMTEVVDPHMSKEDLKMLRIKHRNSERRDIVKADNDYLKALFEHIQKDGITIPAFAGAGQAMVSAATFNLLSPKAGMQIPGQGAGFVDVQV